MTSPAESARKIDPWGRVIFPPESLFDLLYRGVEPNVITAEDSPNVQDYNKICLRKEMPEEQFGSSEPLQTSPQDEQKRRLADWHISGEYASMDVRNAVLALCKRQDEHDRVTMELELYEARGLFPLLRLMFALVAHFRAEGIVYGVGRGSSVSSYVLFLIGVHRIDAIKYDLSITDFLKE